MIIWKANNIILLKFDIMNYYIQFLSISSNLRRKLTL